jgi:DUF4097 and DUF4098 domain-containing protein YvlB
MKTKATFVALTLFAVVPVSAARREIDETRPAARDGEVTVEVLAGDVRVQGWDREEVRLTGFYDDESAELHIDAEGGDVSIVVDVLEGKHDSHGGDVELELRVPAGGRLEVEAISGDISVSGLRGEASIEAISGDIDVAGELRELQVECISGDLNVQASPSLQRADLSTVSGDIRVEGPIRAGRLSIEAVNGDITVALGPASSARFEVETFSGDIKNEIGPKPERTSEHLPSKALSFSYGDGQARVSIETFEGSVHLLQQK